jgi:hypothetical protein
MLYQELHRLYGSYIAKRIQGELSMSEFEQLDVDELPSYLEMRAEAAHKEYQARLTNPFLDEERGEGRTLFLDTLCRNWREAESLAYLISIADDVCVSSRGIAVGER